VTPKLRKRDLNIEKVTLKTADKTKEIAFKCPSVLNFFNCSDDDADDEEDEEEEEEDDDDDERR